MSELVLKGITYSKTFPFFRRHHGSLIDCWHQIAICLNKHLNTFSHVPSFSNIRDHYLCSTINTMSFTSGQITWGALHKLFEQTVKIPPNLYIDAYECASWGYALRYHINQYSTSPNLLLSILDIDFFDLNHWLESPHWGKSGFGITTLFLEKTANKIKLIASCANGASPITEFAFTIKEIVKSYPQCMVAVPFFPEPARNILSKIIGQFAKFPDLHNKGGHCFGSDPWVSIIERLVINNNLLDKELLACSYALNSYIAIVKIKIANDITYRLFDMN